MRVKVGDTWYKVEPGQPIMVELKPKDKENLSRMHPNAECYAIFHDSDTTTRDEKLAWMNEGRYNEGNTSEDN